MPDPVERFIAAATAPLADNAELQMTAGEELRSTLVGGDVSGDKIAATAESLERSRPSRAPRICLYLAVALVSAVAGLVNALDFPRYQLLAYHLVDFPFSTYSPSHRFSSHTARELPPLIGKFTPEEELLVFGDLSPARVFTADQFGTAWHQKVGDAAFFAENGRARARGKVLHATFLDQADKVDRGNAYYPLLAAKAWFPKAIDRGRPGTKKSPYAIKNPADLAAILQLLEEASRQPRFDSYQGELLMRRLKVLPAGEDLPGRWFAQELSRRWYPDFGCDLSRAVAAQAYELAAAGDAAGYQKLCATWEKVMLLILQSEGSLPEDAVWAGHGMAAIAYDLTRAARMLKLDAEMRRYREMSKKLNQRQYRHADWESEEGITLRRRSSEIYDRSREEMGHTLVIVTPDDSALKPARVAEHAFASRFLAYAGWLLVLPVALLTAVCRFRHGGQARRLSASLVRALGAREQAWIIGGGVVAPLAIYLLLEHFTPLGGRHWNFFYTDSASLLRMAAILVLMLLFPCAIAARFLQQRLGFLGWKSLSGGVPFVCSMTLAAWLIGAGMGWLGNPQESDTRGALVAGGWLLLVIPAVCGIGYPLNVLAARRHAALEALTACRAVIPAQACGMLLLAAVSFLYHAEERYWIRRDTLTKPDPEVPSWTRIDYEAAKQARAELLEIFQAKP